MAGCQSSIAIGSIRRAFSAVFLTACLRKMGSAGRYSEEYWMFLLRTFNAVEIARLRGQLGPSCVPPRAGSAVELPRIKLGEEPSAFAHEVLVFGRLEFRDGRTPYHCFDRIEQAYQGGL